MAIDMKRRKKIISLSRGATSIKQFRGSKEEIKHRGKEREAFRQKAIAKGETPKDWAKAKKTPEKFREPAPGFTPVEQVAQAPTQPTGQAPIQAQPTEAPGVPEEKKGLWEQLNEWATWREGNPMREDIGSPQGVSWGEVAGATAVGLSIASLGVSFIATGGLTLPTISTIARGKITKETGKVILGKATMNTKNAGRVVSYLKKIIGAVKRPDVVLGLWGLGMWGKAEGVEGLGFQYVKAMEQGHTELATEIDEIYQEALNPSLVEGILAIIPFIQIPITAKRINYKVEAARTMRDVANAERDRINAGELSPEEVYWLAVEENRKKAKEEERTADEKYWSDIKARKKEIKEIERANDEAYWAGVLNK